MKTWLLVSTCLLLLASSPVNAKEPMTTHSTVGGGFGVQIKPDYAHDDALKTIHDTGFGYVRFSVGWEDIEKSSGAYSWSKLDSLVQSVRKNGLKMVIVLLGGHRGYDGVVPAPMNNVDHVAVRTKAPSLAFSVDAFARFSAAAVIRYGGKDIVWELWNEPDLPRFWPPRVNVHDYAVLVQSACERIKAVSPQAFVAGPGLARIPDERDNVTDDFIGTFLSSPAALCLDAVSVHPYRHGPEEPEAVYKDYARLVDILGRRRLYFPIINTESGYSTTTVPEPVGAGYALRQRFLDMIWGVPVTILYEWQDAYDDKTDPEGNFGLQTVNAHPKAAFNEIAGLLPALKDAVLIQKKATVDSKDVIIELRSSDGDELAVGWTLADEENHVFEDETYGPVRLNKVPKQIIKKAKKTYNFGNTHDRK